MKDSCGTAVQRSRLMGLCLKQGRAVAIQTNPRVEQWLVDHLSQSDVFSDHSNSATSDAGFFPR
jgi:hypothetical protein